MNFRANIEEVIVGQMLRVAILAIFDNYLLNPEKFQI